MISRIFPTRKLQTSTLSALKHLIDVRVWISLIAALLTLVTLSSLPQSDLFWRILAPGFSDDSQFQLQGLFLPDRSARLDLLIVGDSTFHRAINQDNNAFGNDANRVIINGYEAEDVRQVFQAIRSGQRATTTQACKMILQISPNFSVRMRAFGPPQRIDLIATYDKRRPFSRRLSDVFKILEAWIRSNATMKTIKTDDLRIAKHIGQARYADVGNENWERAFRRIAALEGEILGVLDTRGSDWGEGSNLISNTRALLEELASSASNFEWTTLEEFPDAKLPSCNNNKQEPNG